MISFSGFYKLQAAFLWTLSILLLIIISLEVFELDIGITRIQDVTQEKLRAVCHESGSPYEWFTILSWNHSFLVNLFLYLYNLHIPLVTVKDRITGWKNLWCSRGHETCKICKYQMAVAEYSSLLTKLMTYIFIFPSTWSKNYFLAKKNIFVKQAWNFLEISFYCAACMFHF